MEAKTKAKPKAKAAPAAAKVKKLKKLSKEELKEFKGGKPIPTGHHHRNLK